MNLPFSHKEVKSFLSCSQVEKAAFDEDLKSGRKQAVSSGSSNGSSNKIIGGARHAVPGAGRRSGDRKQEAGKEKWQWQ